MSMMSAFGGSKLSQASTTLPPRKIDVKKFVEARGPELEALHSIVADRLNNNFRSRRNKRRRTTAYNNQISRKRCKKMGKFGEEANKGTAVEKDEEKKVPHRVRRRAELRMNPKDGFVSSGDGTKRLRTHVWHAKRFTMVKLWDFYLPLGLQGRGRGSRGLLKWLEHGVLVHDASYNAAVQLEGTEDSLMSVLKSVMVPSPSALSEGICHSVISGVTYGSAMLYHFGASVSQPIAPVSYMWRPVQPPNENSDATDHSADGCNKQQNMKCSSSFRQMWVWIHVSALSEGMEALKCACQKEMDERRCLVKCFSREGQLAKLEVLGSKAFQHLQKILHPVTRSPENSWQLKKHSVAVPDRDSTFNIIEKEEGFSTHAILSLRVQDPRIRPETRIVDVPELNPTSMYSVQEAESKADSELAGISDKNELPTIWSKPDGNSISYYDNELWDSSSWVSPPMEEAVLCMEKHHLRMDEFCLDYPNSGGLNTSTKVQCSRSCPILLLKNSNLKGSTIGWSIVLPLSWVKAFWVPLLSKGAHAIGLREKHWAACQMVLPFFPRDFPDCNAYTNLMATEAAAFSQKAESCPPDVKPWRVPIPPPWDTVRLAFSKEAATFGGREIHKAEDAVDGNLLSDSNSGNCSRTSFFHHDNRFDGLLARSYFVLTNFLREIQGDQLLLFPQLPDRKNDILKFMKDDSIRGLSENSTAQCSYDRKLCYLRVLLHAHAKGVFEEGAVVCAPQLTDVSLLLTRSGNDEGGLQMPQSAVRSYFKEQSSSSRWELHIPDDAALRESHRWPIGFVTTGFVRGSKKPVAVAFCEAVLLAHLRKEQWKNLPRKRKKEIYVLVRNLRSSSYRLALATIVLEEHEDLEFM